MSSPSIRTTGLGLAAVGSVLLANGAWYSPIMFSADPSSRLSEYGGELPFRLYYYVYLASLAAFVLILPRLGHLRGSTQRTLPGWVVPLLLVTTVLQAGTVYAQAFIVPFLAEVAPVALDHAEIELFAISMMVIWSAFSLALVALATTGAIRRIVPVPAAVLISVGALAVPILGPAGSILIGGGLLFWAMARVLRSPSPVQQVIQSDSPEPVRA